MSAENLKTWEALCRPPTSALKKISGGRLSGKSDINPQWRYQAMTEQFGPCGLHWKFTIDRLWTEPGVDGEVFAFSQINLYWCIDPGIWSDPIPGIGGSMLISKEKNGLYCNDEAFKMATTDALGVAMKMLGVAADIYLGNFDGSKYLTPPAEEIRKAEDGQKKERAEDRKTGWAILKAGAESGTEGLKRAWSTLTASMREVCKDDKEVLKKDAQAVDARKENNHA